MADLIEPMGPEDEQTPAPSVTVEPIGQSARPRNYDDLVAQTAVKYGVDPALAIAVHREEYNPNQWVSSAGARGPMQLMPGTAKDLGVKDIDDPEQNVDGGVRYLKQMLDMKGGSVPLALASYNAGPGKVGNSVPTYTSKYVNDIMNRAGHMQANPTVEPMGPDDTAQAPTPQPQGGQTNTVEPMGADDVYQQNAQYVKPGATSFYTQLSPDKEQQFRQWVQDNNVPFHPELPNSAVGNIEYDMRGFWQGLQNGDPHAQQAIDPNDGKMHFNDYWKTPYHGTFSRESQYATPDAPYWTKDDKLIDKNGNVLFDDRAGKQGEQPTPSALSGPAPQPDTGSTGFFTNVGIGAREDLSKTISRLWNLASINRPSTGIPAFDQAMSTGAFKGDLDKQLGIDHATPPQTLLDSVGRAVGSSGSGLLEAMVYTAATGGIVNPLFVKMAESSPVLAAKLFPIVQNALAFSAMSAVDNSDNMGPSALAGGAAGTVLGATGSFGRIARAGIGAAVGIGQTALEKPSDIDLTSVPSLTSGIVMGAFHAMGGSHGPSLGDVKNESAFRSQIAQELLTSHPELQDDPNELRKRVNSVYGVYAQTPASAGTKDVDLTQPAGSALNPANTNPSRSKMEVKLEDGTVIPVTPSESTGQYFDGQGNAIDQGAVKQWRNAGEPGWNDVNGPVAPELPKDGSPTPIENPEASTQLTPLDTQAHEAATSQFNDLQEPTQPQIEAGNYAKGHVNIQGLDISIENPRGSIRRGVDENGQPWENPSPDHYGYIKGTEGADGDHVDTYVGPDRDSQKVFLVDQIDPKTEQFDEVKALIGYDDPDKALDVYRRGFNDGSGPSRIGQFSELSMDEFKDWLKKGDTKSAYAFGKEAVPEVDNGNGAAEPVQPGMGQGLGTEAEAGGGNQIPEAAANQPPNAELPGGGTGAANLPAGSEPLHAVETPTTNLAGNNHIESPSNLEGNIIQRGSQEQNESSEIRGNQGPTNEQGQVPQGSAEGSGNQFRPGGGTEGQPSEKPSSEGAPGQVGWEGLRYRLERTGTAYLPDTKTGVKIVELDDGGFGVTTTVKGDRRPHVEEPLKTIEEARDFAMEQLKNPRPASEKEQADGQKNQNAEEKIPQAKAEEPAAAGGNGQTQRQVTDSAKTAELLRKTADGLQNQIDAKRNPGSANQNPTKRRSAIIAGMAADADHLERTQGILNNLADAHEAGAIPESLAQIKSKALVEQMETVLNRAHLKSENSGGTPISPVDAANARFGENIHTNDLRELVNAVNGAKGIKDEKVIVSNIIAYKGDNPEGYGRRIDTLQEVKAVEALLSKAKISTSYSDKTGISQHTASNIKSDIANLKRLMGAGIDSTPKLQAALADYIEMRPGAKEESPQAAIRAKERELIGTKIPGYFPTPRPLAESLVERADIRPGMKVLEPSAGKGNIADAIREAQPGAKLDTIEPSTTLRSILKLKGHELAGDDFLNHTDKYDRIVMNPPFENGQDIDHVRHAYDSLEPGGKLVSIMSEGPFFRNDKKATTFREWLDDVGGTSEKLPEGSFKGKESERQTGTATRVVEIEKPGQESVHGIDENVVPSGISDIGGTAHERNAGEQGTPIEGPQKEQLNRKASGILASQRGLVGEGEYRPGQQYPGIRPAAEIVSDLRNFAGSVGDSMGRLVELGVNAIKEGAQTLSDFTGRMRDHLGDMYDKYKPMIIKAWQQAKDILSNERGSIGEGPSLLQREKPPGGIFGEQEEQRKNSFVGDVKEAAVGVRDAVKAAGDDFARVFSPMSRGEAAEKTGRILRENLAEEAQKADRAEAASREAARFFDSQPKADKLAFIDNIETGRGQPDENLRGVAATIRGLLDERVRAVRELGTGKLQHLIEDYFPHLWKDPDKANRFIADWYSKRPMEGRGGFLKRRSIPTIAEGIAAGLEPVDYNPITLMRLKLREIDKYVMAHKTINEAADRGIGYWQDAREKIPDGMTLVNDKIATQWKGSKVSVRDVLDEFAKGSRYELFKKNFGAKVMADDDARAEIPGAFHAEVKRGGKSYTEQIVRSFLSDPETFRQKAPNIYRILEESSRGNPELQQLWKVPKFDDENLRLPVGGLIKDKVFVMPQEAAQVINNYLSPGLREKSAVFRGYLTTANIMNQVQLGLSAFHAGFTSLDAMVSTLGLARRQLMAGDFEGAGVSALKTATLTAPIFTARLGGKVRNEWFNPGSESTEIQNIVSALRAGGGRARMDDFYRTHITQNMMQLFRDAKEHLGNGELGNAIWAGVKGAARAPFSAIELQAKPIMEWLVPRQKMGVFADLMGHELKTNPGMTHEEIRQTAGKIWDSVDNRMGQLVYDNLFWNKTAKDIGMASVRSLGWNLGDIRELGGAGADTLKALKNLATGQKADFTYKMDYAIALPLVVGALGAVTNYLMTGQAPQDLRDIFAPRTGRLDPNGSPERIWYPSYIKDIYHMSVEPGKTVVGKLHPMLNAMAEMLQNKDYYGTEIRHKDDPAIQQAADLAKHMGETFVPFGMRNIKRELDTSGGETTLSNVLPKIAGHPSTLLPMIGITPAPKSINQTPAERLLDQEMAAHREQGSRTKAEAQRSQGLSAATNALRTGDTDTLTSSLSDLAQKGLMKQSDMKNLTKRATIPPLVSKFEMLATGINGVGADPDAAVRVFAKANEQERELLMPELGKMVKSLKNTYPDKYLRVLENLSKTW